MLITFMGWINIAIPPVYHLVQIILLQRDCRASSYNETNMFSELDIISLCMRCFINFLFCVHSQDGCNSLRLYGLELFVLSFIFHVCRTSVKNGSMGRIGFTLHRGHITNQGTLQSKWFLIIYLNNMIRVLLVSVISVELRIKPDFKVW